jgi:ribosomal protein S18 acetylase RimI-like enzyme
MLRGNTRGWLARNAPQQILVILLGMLGVDERFQGMGLGRNLLLDASQRAAAISETIGARALVVDPASDAARRLYESCGFRSIPDSDRMFAKLG